MGLEQQQQNFFVDKVVSDQDVRFKELSDRIAFLETQEATEPGITLLYSNSSTISVVSTLIETNLLSFILPANTLGTDDWVEVHVPIKIMLTSGGGTVVFKLKYGATTVVTATSAIFSAPVTGYGTLIAKIKGNGATNSQLAILYFDGNCVTNVNSVGVADTGTAAEDSTGTLTIDITADPQISSAACGAVSYGGYAQHIQVPA